MQIKNIDLYFDFKIKNVSTHFIHPAGRSSPLFLVVCFSPVLQVRGESFIYGTSNFKFTYLFMPAWIWIPWRYWTLCQLKKTLWIFPVNCCYPWHVLSVTMVIIHKGTAHVQVTETQRHRELPDLFKATNYFFEIKLITKQYLLIHT